MGFTFTKKENLMLQFISTMNSGEFFEGNDYFFDEIRRGKDANVSLLVFGFNEYSQTLVSAALQALQLPHVKLNVTVFCSEEAEATDYLSKNPEIQNFFSVKKIFNESNENGGSESSEEEISDDLYGRICFGLLKNTGIDLDIDDKAVYYYFGEPENMKGIYRISTANPKDIKEKEEFKELERMALNVHLVWNDFDKTKIREFSNDIYNYISSLMFALCLKLKLKSIGIYTDTTAEQMAAEYKKLTSDDAVKKEITELLGEYEHRRWVTEKICAGVKAFGSEEKIEYNAQDKDVRESSGKHICVAKSCRENPLSTWTEEDWDGADVRGLDPLDTVSVQYHRALLEYAKENISGINDSITKLSEDCDSLPRGVKKTDLQDYITCASMLLEYKNRGNAALYKKSLDRVKKRFDGDNAKEEKIEELDKKLKYVLLSREYKNYKQIDIDMMGNIPFILLYRTDINILCEFSYGTVSELFKNVAVIRKIKPEKVTFFCINKKDKNFRKAFSRFSQYAREKLNQTSIDFIVGGLDFAEEHNITAISSERDYIDRIKGEALKNRTAVVTYTVSDYSFIDFGCPNTVFDPEKGEFVDENSDILMSVKFPVFIDLNDVMTLSGAKPEKKKPQMLSDSEFDKMWEIYSLPGADRQCQDKRRAAWKNITKVVKKYFEISNNRRNMYALFNKYKPSEDDISLLIELINAGAVKVNKKINNVYKTGEVRNGESGQKEIVFTDNLKLRVGVENDFSIEFTNTEYKQLLSLEGRILEHYVYRKCLESGSFDDIATSYEIMLENEINTNEMDVIMIDGLRCIILECKATVSLDQKFYEKLYYLRNEFGVNPYAFVVNDSVDRTRQGYSENIARGENEGIQTLLINERDRQPNGEIAQKLYDMLKIN